MEKVHTLTQDIQQRKQFADNEENTKNYLILPFISMLGYRPYEPLECRAEFSMDMGTKKGEKVDYALLKDAEPIILVEAKSVGEQLENHYGQIFRYFKCSNDADFAVLTNGIEYHFYTDLNKTNVLDEKPFFIFNILNYTQEEVDFLHNFKKERIQKKFTKENMAKRYQEIAVKKAFSSLMSSQNQELKLMLSRYLNDKVNHNLSMSKLEKIVEDALLDILPSKVEKKAIYEFPIQCEDGKMDDVSCINPLLEGKRFTYIGRKAKAAIEFVAGKILLIEGSEISNETASYYDEKQRSKREEMLRTKTILVNANKRELLETLEFTSLTSMMFFLTGTRNKPNTIFRDESGKSINDILSDVA